MLFPYIGNSLVYFYPFSARDLISICSERILLCKWTDLWTVSKCLVLLMVAFFSTYYCCSPLKTCIHIEQRVGKRIRV